MKFLIGFISGILTAGGAAAAICLAKCSMDDEFAEGFKKAIQHAEF